MLPMQNEIPLLAIFVEAICGGAMFFLAVRAIIRYFERKSKVTLYLMIGLFAMSLAALTSAFGKYLQYSLDIDPTQVSYDNLTITIAYVFLTVSNIVYAMILQEFYLEEDSQSPIYLNIINALIIGLILAELRLAPGLYEDVTVYLLIFMLVTAIIHMRIIRHSRREAKNTDEKVAKTGYKLISYFSATVVVILIFFIIDLLWGTARGYGYTVFYYLAWILVVFTGIFGFLGFIMPEWFKKRIENP
jgi:hypothetical protein